MIVLLVSIASILVLYCLYRFFKYIFVIYVILCSVLLLSFPLMIIDLDLGAIVAVCSFILIVSVFLLTLISGFVGTLLYLFILGPVSMTWMSIKAMILLRSKNNPV